MRKYYSLPMRIVSVITLAAFVFTEIVPAYADGFKPNYSRSMMRALNGEESEDSNANGIADVSESIKRELGAFQEEMLTSGAAANGAQPKAGKPESATKTSNIRELFRLFFSWLPHVNADIDEATIEGCLKRNYHRLDNIGIHELEAEISNADLSSSDGLIIFLALVRQWIDSVQDDKTIVVDNAFIERTHIIVSRYLTGLTPLDKTKESLLAIMTDELHIPNSTSILDRPFQQLLKKYYDNFHERFLPKVESKIPSRKKSFRWEDAISQFVRLRWRHMLWAGIFYNLIRSDIIGIFFSTWLWMGIGSFVGGVTLILVVGFLTRYILRPFYEGLLINLENYSVRDKEPLAYSHFTYGTQNIHQDFTWPEIRRTYYETASCALEGENLDPARRLYLFEGLLGALPAHQPLRQAVRNIRINLLQRDYPVNQNQLWEIVKTELGSTNLLVNEPAVLFVCSILNISPRRPPPQGFWHNFTTIIVLAVIEPFRVIFSMLNMRQTNMVLFNIKNWLMLWFGLPMKPQESDIVRPRYVTQINPFLISQQNDNLKDELFAYLKNINIKGMEPLLQYLQANITFKFARFVDYSWWPKQFDWLANPDKAFLPVGEYAYDLANNTVVLSSEMPLFVNAIVLVKLISLAFQHQVILGENVNIHLTDTELLALQHQLLIALIKDFFVNGADYLRKERHEYAMNLIHLIFIISHAWGGRVHSYSKRPGVLTAKSHFLAIQPFIKAKEAFVVSCYLLFAKRFLAQTDQPPYKTTGGKKTRAGLLASIFSFIKPMWPIIANIFSGISYTALFMAIFGGFFLHLDLEFLSGWFSEFIDFLRHIDLFNVGDYITLIWQELIGIYTWAANIFSHLLQITFHIDIKWLQDALAAFWEWLYPLRTFVEDYIVPFFYQIVLPGFLFFWGMVYGYLIHKLNPRGRLIELVQRRAAALASFIVSLVYQPIKGIVGFFGDEATLDLIDKKIPSSERFVVKLFQAAGIPLINTIFLGLHIIGIALCAILLIFIAYPAIDLSMVLHAFQSIGIPISPWVYVWLTAIAIGFPYSLFYAVAGRIMKAAPARAWLFGLKKAITRTMVIAICIITVIMPSLFNALYKTNPSGNQWIRNNKQDNIVQLREWIYDQSQAKDAVSLLEQGTPPKSHTLFEHMPPEAGQYASLVRLLPDRFTGKENIVNPKTGRAIFTDEFGEPLIREYYGSQSDRVPMECLDWLKRHKAEISSALEQKIPAIYGNSAFFDDLFLYFNDGISVMERWRRELSFRTLFKAFSADEWRTILNHMFDILAGKVKYRTYAETYYAQAKALNVISWYMWGGRDAFSKDPEDTYFGINLDKPPSKWNAGDGWLIMPLYTRDNTKENGFIPANALRFDASRYRVMVETIGHLLTLNVSDPDIQYEVDKHASVFRKYQVLQTLSGMEKPLMEQLEIPSLPMPIVLLGPPESETMDLFVRLSANTAKYDLMRMFFKLTATREALKNGTLFAASEQEITDILVETVTNNNSSYVRCLAAELLIDLGNETAIAALTEAVLRETLVKANFNPANDIMDIVLDSATAESAPAKQILSRFINKAIYLRRGLHDTKPYPAKQAGRIDDCLIDAVMARDMKSSHDIQIITDIEDRGGSLLDVDGDLRMSIEKYKNRTKMSLRKKHAMPIGNVRANNNGRVETFANSNGSSMLTVTPLQTSTRQEAIARSLVIATAFIGAAYQMQKTADQNLLQQLITQLESTELKASIAVVIGESKQTQASTRTHLKEHWGFKEVIFKDAATDLHKLIQWLYSQGYFVLVIDKTTDTITSNLEILTSVAPVAFDSNVASALDSGIRDYLERLGNA